MPPRIAPRLSALAPSPSTHCTSCLRRAYSSTPRLGEVEGSEPIQHRKMMWAWLNREGQKFKEPSINGHNYLGAYDPMTKYDKPIRETTENTRRRSRSEDEYRPGQRVDTDPSEASRRPFPLNRNFVSEPVLSEALRLEVWKRIQVDKKSVRQVSVELNISMERIGAVVRLVEVEKRMRAEGAELALPYAEAMHRMLPVTEYNATEPAVHESINDLPHHPLTAPQIFYPTSESRAFNRTDAGRVFSAAPRLPDSQDVGQGGKPLSEPWADTHIEVIGKRGHEAAVLKPADARIPHPHLIRFEQDKADPAIGNDGREVQLRYRARLLEDQEKRAEFMQKREQREEQAKTRVDKGKWQFIFSDVNAERGVGHRYGVPSQDRKRAQVKIPTRVQV